MNLLYTIQYHYLSLSQLRERLREFYKKKTHSHEENGFV